MRASPRLLSSSLLFAALLSAGCQERALELPERPDGGHDLRQPDDSGVADFGLGSGDAAMQPTGDLSGLGGVQCGMQTCGVGALCCLQVGGQDLSAMCVMADTCPSGAIPASCDGPEDCASTTPHCCIGLALGAGGQPIGAAQCTASCPASVKIAGGGMGGGKISTQLCHSATDCTGYTGDAPFLGMTPFDRCCSLPAISLEFCAPSLLASLGGGVTCD